MREKLNILSLEEAIARVEKANCASARLARFESLIAKTKMRKDPLGKCINYLENLSKEEEMQIFYVGGFLRDLWLGRDARDVDIVFNIINKYRFEQMMEKNVVKRNRFGGLKLDIEGMSVDAWPVEDTHSFLTREFLPSSINIFPATTFFTAESIVLEAYAPQGKRWGWEKDFFDACAKKELEIQNSVTPFPTMQLARTYNLTRKLGWKVGRKLTEFIDVNLPKYKPTELAEQHRLHYGTSVDANLIYQSLKCMRKL